jgi:hypothetical protein
MNVPGYLLAVAILVIARTDRCDVRAYASCVSFVGNA